MRIKLFIAHLIFLIVLLICSAAKAQTFYLGLSGGYHLGNGKVTLGENYTSSNGIGSSDKVSGSYGEGFHIMGTLGFNLNENFGLECDVNFIDGRSFETSYFSSHNNGTGQLITSQYNLESKTEFTQIVPSFVIRTNWSKVDPYAKVGLIFGTGTIFYSLVERDSYDNFESYYELNGGLGIGVKTAIGANVHLNEWISFFGEFSLNNLSYAPNYGKITSLIENGAETVDDLSVHEREVEFVDHYNFNYNENHQENEPSKAIKTSYPLGSFGLQLGLKIYLNGFE